MNLVLMKRITSRDIRHTLWQLSTNRTDIDFLDTSFFRDVPGTDKCSEKVGKGGMTWSQVRVCPYILYQFSA